MKWIAAGKSKPPRSLAGDGTTVIFENKTDRRVKVYWISYKGERKLYAELEPGATRQQNTRSNATWLITDENDEPLGHFIAGPYEARAVIPNRD